MTLDSANIQNSNKIERSPEEINELLEKGEINIIDAFKQLRLEQLKLGQDFETPPVDLPFINFDNQQGNSTIGYLAISEAKVIELTKQNLPIIFATENFSTQLLNDCEAKRYAGIIVASAYHMDEKQFIKSKTSENIIDFINFGITLSHFKIEAAAKNIIILSNNFSRPAFQITRSNDSSELIYSCLGKQRIIKEGEPVSLDAEFRRLYHGKLSLQTQKELTKLNQTATDILRLEDLTISCISDSLDAFSSNNAVKFGINSIGLNRTELGARHSLLLNISEKSNNSNYTWSQYWQEIEDDNNLLTASVFNKELDTLSPIQNLTRKFRRYAAGGVLFPSDRSPTDLFYKYCYSEHRIEEALEQIAIEDPDSDLTQSLDSPATLEDLKFIQLLFEIHQIDHPLANDDPETLEAYSNLIEISNNKLTLKEILLADASLKIDRLKFPIAIRLVDLKGILNYLPLSIQEQFLAGLESQIDSDIFKFKLKLYQAQTYAIIGNVTIRSGDNYNSPNLAVSEFASPIEILVPAISNAIELKKIKALVIRILEKCNYYDESDRLYFKFGAMLETAKSLENAGDIAEICDFVKFGTNDLTQELTGLNRGIFDHSDWMKERGYDLDGYYKSPFDTLVPDVLDRMKDAIEDIKQIKPDLSIGVCGHQMTDWRSILAVLDIGVQNISVPPTYSDITRAKIITAKYVVEKALNLSNIE